MPKNAAKIDLEKDFVELESEKSVSKLMAISFLEDMRVELFMLSLTLYALFGSDIIALTTDSRSETAVGIAALFSMLIFFAEFAVMAWAKPKCVASESGFTARCRMPKTRTCMIEFEARFAKCAMVSRCPLTENPSRPLRNIRDNLSDRLTCLSVL